MSVLKALSLLGTANLLLISGTSSNLCANLDFFFSTGGSIVILETTGGGGGGFTLGLGFGGGSIASKTLGGFFSTFAFGGGDTIFS